MSSLMPQAPHLEPSIQQRVQRRVSACEPGVSVVTLPAQNSHDRMAAEVLAGLSQPSHQRQLPCTYFYDTRGSELYEQITHLPEYYPTRTEASMLGELAPIAPSWLDATDTTDAGIPHLIELGSGSATKTRLLLNAWDTLRQPLVYIPVDVSETMLEETAHALSESYRHLSVLGLAGHYEDALALLPPHANRLCLFLGGTIGNFTPEYQQRFFTLLRHHLGKGTKLLLGFDRRPHAGKPVELIEHAYNDSQGVTAAFNLNLLNHINKRLDANFDLHQWRHVAVYHSHAHQIEMYLESQTPQTVDVLDHSFLFAANERILTEISRKFDPDELAAWFALHGFKCLNHWTDPDERFGLTLLEIQH